jgi:polyhydroxyalkanoate synthesis regulator phasin
MKSSRKKMVAGGVAALAVAGGGVAIAATQLDSPSQRSAAIVSDAAAQLGVQPSALSDALKNAEKKQVDAAVAAGELTQQQGDAIKSAIDSGQVPLVGGFGLGDRHGFGPGFGGHHGFGGAFGGLDAAATYLGVTTAQLQTDLQNGQTLADVAKAQGKDVDGLVTAMVNAASTKIDAAVKAGTLTQSQADAITADLKQRITDQVNGVRPSMPEGGPGGFGDRGWDGDGGGFGGQPGGPQGGGSGGTGTFGQPA